MLVGRCEEQRSPPQATCPPPRHQATCFLGTEMSPGRYRHSEAGRPSPRMWNKSWGTSLVAQRLRLRDPNAGGPGSIMPQLWVHMLQLKISQVTTRAPRVALVVKGTTSQCRRRKRRGSIPGSGRSPGGGHGHPLQYSCQENPHGQRGLAGCGPWGRKESDTTEATKHQHKHQYLNF